jgi:NAD(P)-dependent dehydrogenase (short-subunit alcohol dehydrogenase family)
MTKLDGKNVLVTGTTGIGRALAIELAGPGPMSSFLVGTNRS